MPKVSISSYQDASEQMTRLIKCAMTDKRVTQKDLAKMLKCSQQKVSWLLADIDRANFGDLRSIAKVLKIKIELTRG